MITPVLSKTSISKDGITLSLRDATGTYDATTNPGGYGAPNAEEPALVALSAKYWPDVTVYGTLISDNETVISELLGAGTNVTTETFGGTAGAQFSPGVHVFKYYPLELTDLVAELTNGDKAVTIVSGSDIPSEWNENYIGVVFKNNETNEYSKLHMIDASTLEEGTFNIEDVFEGTTGDDYSVYIGPEADLKVLMQVPASECLVGRIANIPESCGCDSAEVNELTQLTMQMFAAQVNFNCMDYQSAHNKVYNVYLTCSDCKTKCSCN